MSLIESLILEPRFITSRELKNKMSFNKERILINVLQDVMLLDSSSIDNMRSHTLAYTGSWIAAKTVMEHLPHSFFFISRDFLLFARIKSDLRRTKFKNEGKYKQAALDPLSMISKEQFSKFYKRALDYSNEMLYLSRKALFLSLVKNILFKSLNKKWFKNSRFFRRRAICLYCGFFKNIIVFYLFKLQLSFQEKLLTPLINFSFLWQLFTNINCQKIFQQRVF